MNKNIDAIANAKLHDEFERLVADANVRIKIGTEIFNFRENKFISQQELAKCAGTTQKVISRIENGDVNLGSSLLYRVAKQLDMPLKIGNIWLVGDTETIIWEYSKNYHMEEKVIGEVDNDNTANLKTLAFSLS